MAEKLFEHFKAEVIRNHNLDNHWFEFHGQMFIIRPVGHSNEYAVIAGNSDMEIVRIVGNPGYAYIDIDNKRHIALRRHA